MMLRLHRLTYCIACILISPIFAESEADPFGNAEDSVDLGDTKNTTYAGYEITPIKSWDAAPVPEPSWPLIKAPITFNASFARPSSVWRVPGGYLASFDRGEFGASLFYADTDGTSWTRILNTHIQSLVKVSKDAFIVAGGLAHLTTSRGEVHLLIRNNKGGWTVRKIIDCSYAVPKIIGTSKSFDEDTEVSEKLAVIAFDDGFPDSSLFGVSRNGTVYAMGELPKKK